MRLRDIVLSFLPRPLRTRVWPLSLRLRQPFRAAFHSSGITVTVLAAAAPLLFSLLSSEPAPSVILFLKVFGLLVPLIFLSGILALWTAEPATYARILVAGRPAKEALYVVSCYIDRTCRRTLTHAIRAEVLFQAMMRRVEAEERIDLPEPLRAEIHRIGDHLRQLMEKLHPDLLRLEEMKHVTAKQLDIPQRRFCDHIFQYSPAIHRERLQKYISNWGALLALATSPPTETKRLEDLVRESRSFINNTRRRRRFQQQILYNRDLHPYIVQFASAHSTSGSLQTYTEALWLVAAMGVTRLFSARSPRTRLRIESEIEERLLFLARKQRAHPGFDLHALLCNALRTIHERPQEGAGLLEEARKIVDKLDAHRWKPYSEKWIRDNMLSAWSFRIYSWVLAIRLVVNRSPEPTQRDRAGQSKSSPGSLFDGSGISLKERLSSFHTMPMQVARLIEDSRKKIWDPGLRDIYDQWLRSIPNNLNGSTYIVSHGYSRTVLYILEQITTHATETLPRLFFLLPEGSDSLDTRVMEYELKLDRNSRPFRTLAAGTENHLLSLLEEQDSVFILLGAECFDKNCRVVHPRGIGVTLSSLRERLRLQKIRSRVVVVAESYKRYPGSLAENTNFYGQHFDRIDLYAPEFIHMIVTEKETFSPG